MAVWMQIFGQNQRHTDLVDIKKYWDKILPSLDLDLNFLKDTLDRRSDEKKLRQDYYIYDKKNWEATTFNNEGNKSIRFVYPLFLADHAKWDGIRVIFYKDLIVILGPFDHFQTWGTIASTKNLREGYGKIVNKIFERYESPSAIYASEWCISDEEGELSFADIHTTCMDNPSRQVDKLEGIGGTEFFIDKLN